MFSFIDRLRDFKLSKDYPGMYLRNEFGIHERQNRDYEGIWKSGSIEKRMIIWNFCVFAVSKPYLYSHLYSKRLWKLFNLR